MKQTHKSCFGFTISLFVFCSLASCFGGGKSANVVSYSGPSLGYNVSGDYYVLSGTLKNIGEGTANGVSVKYYYKDVDGTHASSSYVGTIKADETSDWSAQIQSDSIYDYGIGDISW